MIEYFNKKDFEDKSFTAKLFGADIKSPYNEVAVIAKGSQDLINKDRDNFFNELKKRFDK